MPSDQSFPRELLKQPPSARLNYFRALTIGHPLLLRAYNDLWYAIRGCEPGSIILVQGPAGVGKTTLMQRVERDFKEQFLAELTKDAWRLPVVRIETIAPDSSNFSWKDYFRRLMIALEEPESLIYHKIIQNRANATQSSGLQVTYRLNTSIAKLRHGVEETLRQRRPLAVLVDDIQHLGSGRKLLNQIHIIKSIASVTRTTHVLASTYEQIMLGQMNCGMGIEFKRYVVENRDHQEAFINCLQTFQKHLPLAMTPELVKEWDYFYERCIGCIGVLKDWLNLNRPGFPGDSKS
jgi:hypothetical protein